MKNVRSASFSFDLTRPGCIRYTIVLRRLEKVERTVLEAEMRPLQTKGALNRARQEDKVPAVLYGRGKNNLSLMVEARSLRQLLASGGGNVLIDLQIKNAGKKPMQETVMVKEIQRHLIQKEKLLHVDFIRISMTDRIEVNVQLNFIGEPPGVKEGGVLQILNREVIVKCLPADIPDSIAVDLSGLAIGDSVLAGSIQLAEDIELITDPDEPLAQVLAPAAEEEPEAAEETEEAAKEVEEAPEKTEPAEE